MGLDSKPMVTFLETDRGFFETPQAVTAAAAAAMLGVVVATVGLVWIIRMRCCRLRILSICGRSTPVAAATAAPAPAPAAGFVIILGASAPTGGRIRSAGTAAGTRGLGTKSSGGGGAGLVRMRFRTRLAAREVEEDLSSSVRFSVVWFKDAIGVASIRLGLGSCMRIPGWGGEGLVGFTESLCLYLHTNLMVHK